MERLLEFGRRAVALWCSVYYGRTHMFPRDTTIRVAGLFYRFLKGEPVEAINRDADAANSLREHQPPPRQYVWPDFRKKSKEQQ